MIGRSLRKLARRALHSMLTLHGSPEAIALGTAIGVFVAFTPTVGFQMLIGAFLATLVGANRPAAMIPAWITNPITIPPIFALTYWVGRLFLHGPEVSSVKAELVGVVKSVGDMSFYAFHRHLMAFLRVGGEIYVRMFLGGVIVGAICGGVTYPLMLRAVRSYRRGREHLREIRAARRAERRRQRARQQEHHAGPDDPRV